MSNEIMRTREAIEEFKPAGPRGMAPVDAQMSRAVAEVQAAMTIAKRFPRDENESFARIMRACSRKSLAESSMYSYPRGGQTVTGPSIRLAEVLAQNWGNIDSGIVELEQRPGESVVMAYAWDLETNTRNVKTFTVKHERSARGGVSKLTDPRDIYEMTANQGARRLRACILGVIPGDVVEEAVRACEKTLAGDTKEPLADRLRRVVAAFSEQGVTVAMLEARLGHVIGAAGEVELVALRKIYTSLRDGMAKPGDFFAVEKTDAISRKMAAKEKPGPDDPGPPTREEVEMAREPGEEG